jgi:hypothetical protein
MNVILALFDRTIGFTTVSWPARGRNKSLVPALPILVASMITVIIPTYERPHWIGRCIEDLNDADEIIVSEATRI